MIYVVVYVDYEGIAALLWAGSDKEEAAKNVRRIRKKIQDEIIPLIGSDKLHDLEGPWWLMTEGRRICVMVPSESGQKCVCSELDVGIAEPVLY